MLKRNILFAVTLLGLTSFTEVAGASGPTDFGPLSAIPFGAQIVRFGDILFNKVLSETFGDGSSARSTRVYVYNHSNYALYLLSSSFTTGGFSNGSYIGVIDPKSVHIYSVESHGFFTGVTDAQLWFSLAPGAGYCLHIWTNNPYIGPVDANADAGCGLTLNPPKPQYTIGNNNEVYIDVW